MGLFKLKEKIEKRVIEHRKKASAQILETGFKVDCNYCDQPAATYICSKCGEETCDGCMTVCDICGKVFCAICFEKAWGVIYCATCEQTNNAQHCESRIIDLAKRHNGRLTSKEVASESEMPLPNSGQSIVDAA